MRSIAIRLLAVTVLVFAAVPATAPAALTASDVRIGSQPGFVRVVVDFTGGTLALNEVNATDASPADGMARVEIRARGIRVPALDRSAHGARVRLSRPSAGRAAVQLTSAPGRLKYVRISGLQAPQRLVIDLYLRAPPSRDAEIRTGRRACLTLTSVERAGRRSFRVRGTERDLFEGSFLLRVRDARGRVVGQRIVTARGPWTRTITPTGASRPQPGTVEAVAGSAKDGSLDCLVQVRANLVA